MFRGVKYGVCLCFLNRNINLLSKIFVVYGMAEQNYCLYSNLHFWFRIGHKTTAIHHWVPIVLEELAITLQCLNLCCFVFV